MKKTAPKGAGKAAMKQDRILDKKMTPRQLMADISADKKLLATKKKK